MGRPKAHVHQYRLRPPRSSSSLSSVYDWSSGAVSCRSRGARSLACWCRVSAYQATTGLAGICSSLTLNLSRLSRLAGEVGVFAVRHKSLALSWSVLSKASTMRQDAETVLQELKTLAPHADLAPVVVHLAQPDSGMDIEMRIKAYQALSAFDHSALPDGLR